MPNFRYIAMTAVGERVVGELAGGNEQAVLSELESRRLVPVQVAPVKERAIKVRRRVSTRQLATSYTQLADLLRAGVPLLRSLRLLGARRSAPALAKVFRELGDAVADGTELAEAMQSKPEVFTKVHVAMVRAGEKGGFLEGVFARIGQLLTSQAELRGKVVGNLIYPLVLCVVGTIILGIVFGFFIPMFRPLYQTIELGSLTKAVLAASDIIAHYGIFLVIIIAVGLVTAWRTVRKPSVRRKLDSLSLRVPIFGSIARTLAVARFCRILGTLLTNSIPMLTAIGIARDAVGNSVIEATIDQAADSVRQGQPLAPPLGQSGFFPDDIVEMISVGESANNLDTVLLTIADTVELRLDRQLNAAVKLVEPTLLLVLAVVVALVALALVLPMTKLSMGVAG